MRLSQAHLKLLETCPRLFQYRYLEQLAAPITAEQADHMAWGSRFHRLLQQRELDLPIAPLVEANPQLAHQFHTFTTAVPDIATLTVPEPGLRESEHERTIDLQDHSLVVVYDLLIAAADRAHILDWKTYRQPPNHRQRLQHDWQTRLYLWVLAETSTYRPECLRMTYWFMGGEAGEERSEERGGKGKVLGGGEVQPSACTITYSAEHHQVTQQDLSDLLGRLSAWLDRYQAGEVFPQVAASRGICQGCDFVTRCQRERQPEGIGLDLAAIAEIPL